MLWNCCVEERSKFLEILYGEKGTFSFIYGANSWLKWVNAEWDTFFFSGQWWKHSVSGRAYKNICWQKIILRGIKLTMQQALNWSNVYNFIGTSVMKINEEEEGRLQKNTWGGLVFCMWSSVGTPYWNFILGSGLWHARRSMHSHDLFHTEPVDV